MKVRSVEIITKRIFSNLIAASALDRMGMQHKREVIQLRNIEETLRLCGEDVSKSDVDEIVKSLTKKASH